MRRFFVLLLGLLTIDTPAAFAATTAPMQVSVRRAPIIRATLQSGSIDVYSWDREIIAVHGDAPVALQTFEDDGKKSRWRSLAIPVRSLPHYAMRTLASENFVFDLGEQPHQGIVIKAKRAHLHLYIPRSAVLMIASLEEGPIIMHGLHTNFALVSGNGAAILDHVSGSGYVQSADGIVYAADSTFGRIRVRTARLPIIFSQCRADEIEASSFEGTILFDNGSFGNGPARFVTQSGNLGIGIAHGSVRIQAHTIDGSFASFLQQPEHPAIDRNRQTLLVNGGSDSTVIASSRLGTIAVYNGSVDRLPSDNKLVRTLTAIKRRIPFFTLP